MTEQIGLIWQEGNIYFHFHSLTLFLHTSSQTNTGENLSKNGQFHDALVSFQRAKALLINESKNNYLNK